MWKDPIDTPIYRLTDHDLLLEHKLWDSIIGDPSVGIQARRAAVEFYQACAYVMAKRNLEHELPQLPPPTKPKGKSPWET